VTLYDSCKNQRFGGTYHVHHQGENKQQTMNNVSSYELLVAANVVPSFLIIFTLEAICSSEMSIITEPHGITSQKTAFTIFSVKVLY
jgi:hypothetical protein